MGARGDAGRVRFLARLAVFAALLITSASSGEADADAQLAGARVSGPAGEAFGGPGRELRAAIDDREVDDYHYIFSTDCKPYMDWQSVALYHSWIRAGSPGRFTRILSCARDDYLYRDIMPTHLTPTYDAIDPKDNYAAYNLPGGILHWTQHNTTDRKWVVKLDADMIIRKPLSVREGLRAEPGLVAAGYYGYLEGVDNEMAGMFVDEDARSRLAKVGGWEIFWAEDLRKAAPLWFEYTKRVRQDERVHWPFRGTGDVFITKEYPRPWISEMYGYVFGTAVAGLRHNVQHSTQLYAGMSPWDEASYDPFLVHYGILVEIDDWKWDKHDELNGRGVGAQDKLRCDIPFAPFPEVPERALAKRASATTDRGTPNDAGRRSPPSSCARSTARYAPTETRVAASRFPRKRPEKTTATHRATSRNSRRFAEISRPTRRGRPRRRRRKRRRRRRLDRGRIRSRDRGRRRKRRRRSPRREIGRDRRRGRRPTSSRKRRRRTFAKMSEAGRDRRGTRCRPRIF